MPAKAKKKILVTSALPYANGPIHLGHLVEYIQTDIFVRFLKSIGEDAIYCCADDTHGAPIQINAQKLGITPEALIDKYFREHTGDFAKYQIHFDSYDSTNSATNKRYSDYFFAKAKDADLVYTKEVELTYCEHDKRFLPDRYVKGKCPRCNAPDQYGDVCEKCNFAYNTIDLIDPYCTICRNQPVRKKSLHYFFKLSALSGRLEKWLIDNKGLQDEVRNFALNWIQDGLKDWDISRDGPYFGFNIPGEIDKYYYVWVDAPIGYVSATHKYASENGLDAEADFWKNPDTRIIHFIGKDILYFHLLFWPALLMAAGFKLPSNIIVHGFLTVNGEKMSKSRGTFLTAEEFSQQYNTSFLRYYYAANLSQKLSDLDLSFSDFHDRINNELIANIANFSYRVLSMLNTLFDSKIAGVDEQILSQARSSHQKIKDAYLSCDFREAVKLILHISSLGNKYIQDNAPWKLAKENKDAAHKVVSTAANIVKDLCVLLKPILPVFTEELGKQLNYPHLDWDDLSATLSGHLVGSASMIIKKIDDAAIEKARKKSGGDEKMQNESLNEPTQENQFARLNIKIGEVMAIDNHPNADRLYVLQINLGSEQRQVVAGLKGHYTQDQLLGKKLCILTNLERSKLRGVESQAMLLAGVTEDAEVGVLYAQKSSPGDQVFIEGVEPDRSGKEISHKEFQGIEIRVKDGRPHYDGKFLKTSSEDIRVEKVADGAKVR